MKLQQKGSEVESSERKKPEICLKTSWSTTQGEHRGMLKMSKGTGPWWQRGGRKTLGVAWVLCGVKGATGLVLKEKRIEWVARLLHYTGESKGRGASILPRPWKYWATVSGRKEYKSSVTDLGRGKKHRLEKLGERESGSRQGVTLGNDRCAK